jgi:hypothetical protein
MRRRYTRAELREKLCELGFPISMGKLNKLCAPSVNQGPPIDSWWGERALYRLEPCIAWAEAKLKDKPSALQAPTTATSLSTAEIRLPRRAKRPTKQAEAAQ